MTNTATPRHFDIITLFPEAFSALSASGITRRAHEERKLYELHFANPRDFTHDAHRTVDDRPYGGGPGMVMRPEPLDAALAHLRQQQKAQQRPAGALVYLSPQGRRLNHALVRELAKQPALTLLCGRYEGIDQRFIDRHVDLELSVGDFVVSGGELPAMLLLDALIRQLPGALNDADSAEQDSFANGLLDYPHYTRPQSWQGKNVPEVLLSGDHGEVKRWRRGQSLALTWQRRPDLFNADQLQAQDFSLLEKTRSEPAKAAPAKQSAALS